MKAPLILGLLILSSCITSFESLGGETRFSYVDSFDGSAISFSLSESNYQFLDMVGEASYCDSTMKFICISSDIVSFAVPRGEAEQLSSWNYNGIKYEKEPLNLSLKMFGNEISVAKIFSEHKGNRFVYLYSKRFGLIAIKVSRAGIGKTYFLVQEYGFGSPTKLKGNDAGH